MAYSPQEKYPGAVDTDPNYKDGKFRDNNPSTTNNGSPLKAIDRNEFLARDEAIMNDAGFDYNGQPDTPQNSQMFQAYKASLGNGANLLSNHNFLIASPDASQPPPDATPRSYPPGFQIFSGVFANETSGITNLTYVNGRVSFSGGDFYMPVANTGAIARLTSDQLVASVADFDGKPRTRGVSFALVDDEYRITVGVDALEDSGGNATPLGSVKFEQGSVATGHFVKGLFDIYGDPSITGVLDARSRGLKLDGVTDETSEAQALFIEAKRDGKAVYLKGDLFIGGEIDLTSVPGNLVIYSDYVTGGRAKNTVQGASITFGDDGTDTSGKIGINLGETNGTINLNGIVLKTLINDARAATGNFRAIVADGRGSDVRNCRIAGFTTCLNLFDIGYSNWGSNYYQGCRTVLKHDLDFWPFGTTFHDESSQAVQCGTVYDVAALWHSSLDWGVYEYCDIVVKDCVNGWTLSNCYFENLVTASVQSLVACREITEINNFYNSATDQPQIATGRTDVHGFDSIGSFIADSGNVTAKHHKFYNRSGEPAGYIAASKSADGQIKLVDKDDNVEGNVPFINSNSISGADGREIIKIFWHGASGGVLQGLPDGWTFTDNTTYLEFDFGTSYVSTVPQVTSTTLSTNAANEATHKVAMNGSNWPTFRSATGFRVYLSLNGTENTSACAATIELIL